MPAMLIEAKHLGLSRQSSVSGREILHLRAQNGEVAATQLVYRRPRVEYYPHPLLPTGRNLVNFP
jgi:hypothetical protein